jgi:hypothetical protein
VLINRDGDVWAHIALVCITVNRPAEADQAISQALREGIRDAQLLMYISFLTTDRQ